MDTWRAAYKGIVPDSHLEGLSYDGSERFWHDVITTGDGCVFVAEDGGGIVGVASGSPRECLSRDSMGFESDLKTAYVLLSHQGTGTGRRLVGAVARYLEKRGVGSMLLWVFEENRSARRFYESLGGVAVAEDAFELGGAWLSEVACGWRDLNALLAGVDYA